MHQHDYYRRAQLAIAELKDVVRGLLENKDEGLSNAQIGRALGIYQGHKGHQGHISRTLLAMLEAEGVVVQNEGTKLWSINEMSVGNPNEV